MNYYQNILTKLLNGSAAPAPSLHDSCLLHLVVQIELPVLNRTRCLRAEALTSASRQSVQVYHVNRQGIIATMVIDRREA
jgi:hypothetical protein